MPNEFDLSYLFTDSGYGTNEPYPNGKMNAFFDPSSLWYGGKAPGGENAKPLRRAGYEGQSWLDSMKELYPELFGLNRQAAGDYAGLATDTLGQLTAGRGTGSMDQAASWLRRLNPNATGIRDTLGTQVLTDLQAGSNFTTDEEEELRRQAIQAARARGASAGLGASNLGVAQELLGQFNVGQRLKSSRQGAALNFLTNQYGTETAPAMQHGQYTDTTNLALMERLLGGAVTAPEVNPYNPYNADINNTNLNAFYQNLFSKRSAGAASSAGTTSAIGAGVGAAAGIAGAAIIA